MMKCSEFIEKLLDIEKNYKTLYVMGCFGFPMTDYNKKRVCNDWEYNRKPARTKMIENASADTFGFDCVNLIKAVLWGWKGDKNHQYGGVVYKSNDVPDVNANTMITLCNDISTDFSNIEVGEAVWVTGHIGVYIGNGLAVECTPAWKNRVQITAVSNIGTKTGYNARKWTKHGKLPYIIYDVKEEKPVVKEYTRKDFIKDVQTACGAKVDGIAGEETLSKTVTISAVTNKRHPAVKAIQQMLNTLGYTQVGTADGIAGSKFTAAIKAFQKDNGCDQDGEVTAKEKTWQKLLGYEPKPKVETYSQKDFIKDVQTACGAKVDGIAGSETLSKTVTISAVTNKRHPAVKAVQKRLHALGYTQVGTADGIAGSKFTAAVKAFQKDNGCVQDGEITAKGKTWKKLLGLA